MSDYTDALSPRPGYKGLAGTDDRELFLKEFGQMVLEAWDETNTFENHCNTQSIGSGKSWQFPIIGRKRDAEDHIPGEVILGGGIENQEVEVTLDQMMVDSAFVAEIDALMASYSLSAPYARQLGESLSTTSDKRAAIMHVLASRVATAPYTNGPIPSYYYDAALKTDPSKLEEWFFAAVQYIAENDIGGGEVRGFIPWQQYLLMSKYSDLDSVATSGSANRSMAKIGPIAGIFATGSNHIPKTDITTGLTKYRGNFSTTVGFISNPQAVAKLKRRSMRVTISDKDDRLGTLMIASKLEGYGALRPECSFEGATAVRA